MKLFIRLILAAAVLLSVEAKADIEDLNTQISELETEYNSIIGISVYSLETGWNYSYNGDRKFHLASTVKLPLATLVLNKGRDGKINLDKLIDIKPHWAVPGSSNGMNTLMMRPGLQVSLYNLIEPMMTQSDNTATDILFEQVGGPRHLQHFLDKSGIIGMDVSRSIFGLFETAKDIDRNKDVNDQMTIVDINKKIEDLPKEQIYDGAKRFHEDKRDTTTPNAMTIFLRKFANYEIIHRIDEGQLIEIMKRNKMGVRRIKALLGSEYIVADKTGGWISMTSENSWNIFTNDIAVIYLPYNKGRMVMSVYVESTNSVLMEKQEEAIAKAAKAVIDNFMESQGGAR